MYIFRDYNLLCTTHLAFMAPSDPTRIDSGRYMDDEIDLMQRRRHRLARDPPHVVRVGVAGLKRCRLPDSFFHGTLVESSVKTFGSG